MPHGYLFRSPTFKEHHADFPNEKSRSQLFGAVAAVLKVTVASIEIFKSADEPLSLEPLDVELKIHHVGDSEIDTPAHSLYWVLNQLVKEVDPHATVGVWVVQGARSRFVTAGDADENLDVLKDVL